MKAGEPFGLTPTGLAALDIARIEAGLLLIEVDYVSSVKALTEARKSSPYEIGLGWAVDLEEPSFVGRRALVLEHAAVGLGLCGAAGRLERDWRASFAKADLPPQVAGRAARDPVPIFRHDRQIGQATSRAHSPLLKYFALGTLEQPHARLGTGGPGDYSGVRPPAGPATVVRRPFFDPPRKRS
jgi:aminomethyltransferase